jgi:hypothetical protein
MFSTTSEETIYINILREYVKDGIDFETVGHLIVDACNVVKETTEEVDPRNIVRNALLLVLAMLHKNEPIENLGKDIWSMSKTEIKKNLAKMKDLF